MNQVVEMCVEEEPELRYTKSALAICTLCMDKDKFVAFGDTAEELNDSVNVGDVLRLTGYYKARSWTDKYGDEHTEDNFNIKKWERIG